MAFAAKYPGQVKQLCLASLGTKANPKMVETIREGLAVDPKNRQKMADILIGSFGQNLSKNIKNKIVKQFHAMNPEVGCVLPTLGPEIAQAGPEVRSTVEAALKRTQKSWSQRTGDPDAGWALIAQCVGALVLARAVESERTRKEILAASRRFLDKALPASATPATATR